MFPETPFDVQFEFEGYHSRGGICRFRVFMRQFDMTPAIVLTELNVNKNTSITNRAERVYYKAWEQIGRPWPCLFYETYENEEDSVCEVTFPLGPDGKPLTETCFFGGTAIGLEFTGVTWSPASFMSDAFMPCPKPSNVEGMSFV